MCRYNAQISKSHNDINDWNTKYNDNPIERDKLEHLE